MRLLMVPRLALKALAQNVTRTSLTMLGIIKGQIWLDDIMCRSTRASGA